MNLLEMVLNAQNGGQVNQMAKNLGISGEDARKAIGVMIPSLSKGIQNNVAKENGLNDLIGALSRGNHQHYVDDPDTMGRDETIADGNNILGHIFGNKDVSRNIAGHASKNTGVSTDILKKMLPMLATMAMGALSKQSSGDRSMLSQSMGKGQSSPGLGGLASFLDADKDGDIVDDLLNFGKRFF